MTPLLAGSTDSRAREWRAPIATGPAARAKGLPARGGPRDRAGLRERGIALILSLVTILILSVVLADMHESTAISYALADTQEDRLQAEYLARSGINLTRLVVAAEPQIRQAVTIPYMALMGGQRPPQLPVWAYANEILQPFCDYERAQGLRESTGIDFSAAEGLGETGGRCEMVSFAENSKLNVNKPLQLQGNAALLNVANLVFAMTGGLQQPSEYDPLFEQRDADGQITSRLDVISSLVDWWDADQQRAAFDLGAQTVNTNAGGEDDIYQSFRDPYRVKNAPFDSLEELRYVRGIGDDFWATFVERDPEAPETRAITVYGSGKVNPNEAHPAVLYATTTALIPGSTLSQVDQFQKFMMVMGMVRTMLPSVPVFGTPNHWVDFLQGRGPVFGLVAGFAGDMMFTPITITNDQRRQLSRALVTSAKIITIQATGLVGNCPSAEAMAEDEEDAGPGRCTRVRIRSVMNFETTWAPPPPNAGAMPALGIFYHWRVD